MEIISVRSLTSFKTTAVTLRRNINFLVVFIFRESFYEAFIAINVCLYMFVCFVKAILCSSIMSDYNQQHAIVSLSTV